jgi:hypothetical protein
MALTAHQVTRLQLPYIAPGFYYFTDKLMADDERNRYVRLRPAIPLVNVQIRAAHAGPEYADQHVVPARSGDRNIL